MRVTSLEYAVLGLVAEAQDGIHGYRLMAELQENCGNLWSLNYGQLYRILDRLERCGAIQATRELQVGRPNRKIVRLTPRGRRQLDQWLLLPPTSRPRAIRDELAVKLLFLLPHRTGDALQLIEGQRTIYAAHLTAINSRRASPTHDGGSEPIPNLFFLQADLHLRADLAWLDHVEEGIRQGRLVPREAPPLPYRDG